MVAEGSSNATELRSVELELQPKKPDGKSGKGAEKTVTQVREGDLSKNHGLKW